MLDKCRRDVSSTCQRRESTFATFQKRFVPHEAKLLEERREGRGRRKENERRDEGEGEEGRKEGTKSALSTVN